MSVNELIASYVVKYMEIAKANNKQISKKEIAKIILLEHPELKSTQEQIRIQIIQILRPTFKKGGGVTCANHKYAYIRDQLQMFEPPVIEFDNTPFVFPKAQNKVLVINDIHGRFYDPVAFEIAINYGVKSGCNSVLINGDFLDFYKFSRFDKNPTINKLMNEREWGQDTLRLLQDVFGYVVLKQGNHDKRLEESLASRLADTELIELSGSYADFLFFDGCRVNFVNDKKVIKLGNLNAIHGHEIQGGGGVNVARNRFMKTFTNVISAHSHVSKSDIFKDLEGEIRGSWAVGCLCNLSPAYNPINQWQHGFAVVEIDTDGDFEINNRIIDGRKTFNS